MGERNRVPIEELKMKGRAIIPLVVGLGIGIMALKLFVGVLQKAQGSTGENIQVICATTDIDPTMEIRESMVEVQEVPKVLAPDLAFAKKEEVVGRVTSLTIPKGMPIIPRLLTPKGTPPGMAVRIREGFRAVAVKVDESAGVAGWIKPGSRVDVAVLMTTRRKAKTEQISKVVLQNVEVLAVGQDIGTKGDTAAALAKSVTLLVHPDDVPKLHLAATVGKLRLAMRNQLDYSEGPAPLMTDNDLLTLGTERRNLMKKKESSFLASLFGGQRLQNTDEETDNKKREDTRVTQVLAPPAQVAWAKTNQPWSVEVMKGSTETEVLWFDDTSRAARRVESPENTNQRANANQGTPIPFAGPAVRPTPAVKKE